MKRCPYCQGKRLAKNGKTAAGRQKYRCLDPVCGRPFVAGSSDLPDTVIKGIVLRLLAEKVKPATIHFALPWVSRGWIYKLRRSGR